MRLRRVFRVGESLGELLLRPVHSFASLQFSGGLLIVLMAAVALVWANSPWGESYHNLWLTKLSVGALDRTLDKSIHFWINEGLMTFFFFVVGLEIKREVLIGELASFRKAALPVAAAVGGMLVPAVIYYSLSPSGVAVRGWAIPMATDIAFTIGVLTILGNRVPHSLTVFVAALAIADDLGAVLVIALFYTSNISVVHLQVTALLMLVLVFFNVLGFRRPLPYVLVGSLVWLNVYLSGVHSTVAGILVALTIPARATSDTDAFLHATRGVLDKFECTGQCGFSVYTNPDHEEMIRKMESLCRAVDPPLLRIEHHLSPWVVFGVVPVFALANSGVHLHTGSLLDALTSAPSLGIILGLVIGKQVGIVSVSWLAARLGLAELPEGATWAQLHGCAILCGIGFTMSIFIGDLAFGGTDYLESAKLGILVASLISLVLGMALLFFVSRRKNRKRRGAAA